jgi:arginine decarboxylase-like protein
MNIIDCMSYFQEAVCQYTYSQKYSATYSIKVIL